MCTVGIQNKYEHARGYKADLITLDKT